METMGAIHMEYGMNATELAAQLGRKTDAIRKRWNIVFPGRKFSATERLTADEVAALSGKTEVRKAASRSVTKKGNSVINIPAVSNEVPPGKTWSLPTIAQTRDFIIDILLFSIVAGHALLIWFDCKTLWGMPGLIGGGISFLIVLAALLFAMDSDRPRTSETAMWFVFTVDVGAFWVHYPTFKAAANIGNVETGALCAFLCCMSFAALYLFRDSKLS